MWDEKMIRETNKPIVEAMTNEELKVLAKMIHEEQYSRLQDHIDKTFPK